MTLTITLLGVPRVSGPHGPLTLTRRQPLALLAMLALADAPMSRDELAFLLWADAPQATARQRLRRTLSNLRQALEKTGGADALQTTTDTALLEHTRCQVDVLQFLQHASEAARTPGAAACGPAKHAIEYYQGTLLEGFALQEAPEFERWLATERERLERIYHETLTTLITAATAAGDSAQAIAAAERLLATDPLDETTHCTLMRLYASAGQRTAALQQYERCRALLAHELGIEPLPETQALYDLLRRQVPAPRSEHRDTRRPTALPRWRTRPSLTVPCVGRAAELEQVRVAFTAGLAGYPTVVCVSGPAGIGKTRLLREAVEGLPAVLWLGGGQAAGEAAPYGVALGVIRAALATLQRQSASTNGNGNGAATQPGKPAATLFPDLPDVWLAEVSRLLPEVRLYHPDLSAPPALPPEQARARLLEALTRLFVALVQQSGGALLILDDMGEADPASLAWLGNLVYQIERLPLGIGVAFRRSDESPMLTNWLDDLARLQMRRDIVLDAITPAALAAMLQQMGVSPAVAQQLAPRLWNETGGTPFFVLETLRVLREQHIDLEHLPDQSLPLPSSVQEVIRVRMQSLDAPAQHVLNACAVAGRTFAFEVVQGVSSQSDAATAQALDTLLNRHFLLEDGSAYRFTHAHIAEVAYASIGTATRRLLHQRAADILQHRLRQQHDTKHTTSLNGAIAHHLEQAGQASAAAPFWLTAGQQAWALFAADEALHAFRKGLECLPTSGYEATSAALPALRFALLAGREDVLHHLGERSQQHHDLAEMERLAERSAPPDSASADQVAVARRQGRFFIALNQWGDAERALQRSIAACQHAGLPPDEEVLCLLATALIHQQRRAEAQHCAEEALQHASARGAALAQAHCLLTLSEIAHQVEDLSASEHYLQMALFQAQAATDPVTQAHLTANLAAVDFQRGRFEAALAHAQEAVQLNHTQANREGEARAHALAAMCLARLWRYGEALESYRLARKRYRTIQHTQGLAAATVNAAVLAGRLGNLEQSLELSHEAHALFTTIGDERGICAAASNIGGVLFFLGQSQAAEQWLCEALDRATALALPMQQSSALLNLGGTLLQQERVSEACTMLERGLALRQDMGHIDICATQAYLALAYLRAGDLQRADTLSQQAAADLDMGGGIEHPQQVLFARAQVVRSLGHTEEAQVILEHANRLLLQVLASLATPEEQQRYLHAFPFNRNLHAALQHNTWPQPPCLA